jgi:hypothetical protein
VGAGRAGGTGGGNAEGVDATGGAECGCELLEVPPEAGTLVVFDSRCVVHSRLRLGERERAGGAGGLTRELPSSSRAGCSIVHPHSLTLCRLKLCSTTLVVADLQRPTLCAHTPDPCFRLWTHPTHRPGRAGGCCMRCYRHTLVDARSHCGLKQFSPCLACVSVGRAQLTRNQPLRCALLHIAGLLALET